MSYLNYFIEANLSLILFSAVYFVLLKNESQFRLQRYFLVIGLLLSMLFPLIHLNESQSISNNLIPSISQSLPANWLPEIIISDRGQQVAVTTKTTSYWKWITILYSIVSLTIFLLLLYRIASLFMMKLKSKSYNWNGLQICEVAHRETAFSFFYTVFISQGELTDAEKEKILLHEAVHARQLHSLDILLIHLVQIIFWCNPILHYFKKTLTQLHEFEADSKSIQPEESEQYCYLLAKTALQSSGVSLANHFSNSLTLKRIAMIKTIKRKIQYWKLMSASLIIASIFTVIGCQDQITSEISKSTVTQVGNFPPQVKADIDKLKQKFPQATFSYFEGSAEDIKKMMEEAFKLDLLRGVYMFNTSTPPVTGILLSNVAKHASDLQLTGEIFTVVEESATPKGGMPALYELLASNLKYPDSARHAGVQGKIFVEFVVNENGSLSDFRILKGISKQCNDEAIRALSLSPAWNPGKQNGVTVKQRIVLPIIFNLGESHQNPNEPTYVNAVMKVNFEMSAQNQITGSVLDGNGKPLAGVNVVIKGTTRGTVSSAEGIFKLNPEDSKGTLVFSFVGYQTQEISY